MKHWSTPCCRSYIALTRSGWSVSSDSNRYVYLPPAADVCKFSSLSHDVDQSAARGRKQGRSSALACFVGVGMNISTLSGDVFFYLLGLIVMTVSRYLYVLTLLRTLLSFGGAGFCLLRRSLVGTALVVVVCEWVSRNGISVRADRVFTLLCASHGSR